MAVRVISFTLCCLFITYPSSGAADHGVRPWTTSIYFENDLFADSDQFYTNGVKVTWISPDLTHFKDSGKLPEWSLPIVNRLPFINEPDLQRNVAFSIGQNMYTPRDITREDLIVEDRPYAGWLYFGAAFHSKNRERLDSMEIQMGVVGPLSHAEEAQTFVHEFRGLETPKGWDNQLENEPGLALVWERKMRSFEMGKEGGFGMDFIPHLGAALGNVYTYANIGGEVRFGWNMPKDFGVSLIRPAGDSDAPFSPTDPRIGSEWPVGLHLFAVMDGRAVLHEIFLDGNTFTDSHSVDKKIFVGDAGAGLSLAVRHVKLVYTHVFRSKEFDGQDSGHSFGSMTFSFSF